MKRKLLNPEKFKKLLKSPEHVLIVVKEGTSAAVNHSLILRYRALLNVEIIDYLSLRAYLAKNKLIENGFRIPDVYEESEMFYKAAEDIFNEESYFAGYLDHPSYFSAIGRVYKETESAMLDPDFTKRLANNKKWEAFMQYTAKLNSLYEDKGFSPPRKLSTIAAGEAEILNGITVIFEDCMLDSYCTSLRDTISKNNDSYILPSGIIFDNETVCAEVCTHLREGNYKKLESVNDIELKAYPSAIDEFRGVLNKLMESGKISECCIASADYRNSVLIYKSELDRLGIKAIYGGGVPLASHGAVKQFLSVLSLYSNERLCSPMRNLIGRINPGEGDALPPYLWPAARHIITEHKKNATVKDFGDFLKIFLENAIEECDEKKKTVIEFLIRLNSLIGEAFGKIRQEDSYKASHFIALTETLLKGNKNKAVIEVLLNLLSDLEKDNYFINDPAPVEEKLAMRIRETFTGGSAPDGDALYICPIRGVRGYSFDTIAYTGLNDRAVSQGIPVDPVLNYPDREKVCAGINSIDNYEFHVLNKREDILAMLRSAGERALLSWVSNEKTTGKLYWPSTFVFELHRLLGGEKEGIEALESDAGLVRAISVTAPSDPPGKRLAPEESCCVVDGDAVRDIMSSKPFSHSGLSVLVGCPYRFLLQKLMDIEEEDFSEMSYFEWLDAMSRGSLVHEILSQYCDKYKGKESGPVEELLATAETVMQNMRKETPPPSEALYQAARRWLHRELYRLHSEGLLIKPGFYPEYNELPVGFAHDKKKKDKKSIDYAVKCEFGKHELCLRGIIDRIDTNGRSEYIITDYKTGKSKKVKRSAFLENYHMQHALYPMLLRNSLDSDITKIEAGYFFCTSKGGYEKVAYDIDEADVRADAEKLMESLLDLIYDGRFPANTKNCAYCDLCNLCAVSRVTEDTERYFRILEDTDDI